MQVEGQHELSLLSLMATGARVSNTYPTCPILGHSLSKGRLTPDVVVFPHGDTTKVYGMGWGCVPLACW